MNGHRHPYLEKRLKRLEQLFDAPLGALLITDDTEAGLLSQALDLYAKTDVPADIAPLVSELQQKLVEEVTG